MEMATNRPIPERNWYLWFNRRIKHISESIKKSESETKQKVTRLFVSIIDNSTPTYYKQRKIRNVCEGRNVEHKSEKDKKSSMIS